MKVIAFMLVVLFALAAPVTAPVLEIAQTASAEGGAGGD
jgi:hypothetical protein